MRGRIAWGAAALLFSVVTATAGTTSALMKACSAPPGAPGFDICNAYVNGLAEGVLADQIAREDGTAICLPDGITTQAIKEAVTAFVEKKDVRIYTLPTGGVMAAALQDAYPCRKSR